MQLLRLEVRDFRNLRDVAIDPSPGLNVFVGANAQGKTSLLEAVGLLARGRSFRTDETASLIRNGAERLWTRGCAQAGADAATLEVEVEAAARRMRVDGREVAPRAYAGRLDVVVYATERLPVVRGSMRERRAFLDRGAAALWPSYRQQLRDYERVLRQRNASLQRGSRDIESWDERLVEIGAGLRQRRGEYVRRLGAALSVGFQPGGEQYSVALEPHAPLVSDADAQACLRAELAARQRDERRAGISLAGPHRDRVRVRVGGADAGPGVSSGQARSALLALTLAALEVYRQERGSPALALLDDLDSELDEARARELCAEVGRRAQAFITTAHPGWVAGLNGAARTYHVAAGRVSPA